ncbi:class I SAM-dependent methyltransferase [Shimazuella sp. AN120528]|uniref:class I SAM-dependent methyltransferase n=1 Tax=Shimazuella soli TaxID=1892854 RepID=UPI001F0FC5A1|nr:class I SAM-dependent methyltransferase [Shimazuella soli]MCH5586357.1 class I SAM-dependent methyltransferase [Shimazuella soli]
MFEYEKKDIVDRYVQDVNKIGLWSSEKEIFTKFIHKDDSILDLGCGAGRTTFNLYNMGYTNIEGIDLSVDLINEAKKLADAMDCNISFSHMDARELKYDEQKFDCVFFSYNGLFTIPKYEERSKVLKEVWRVLKDDRLFIFTSYDRNGNSKYSDFWLKEKELWENNQHQKFLYEYGDRYVKFNENELVFIHVADDLEVEKMIKEQNFKLEYKQKKSEICAPSPQETGVYGDCIFYIVRKMG